MLIDSSIEVVLKFLHGGYKRWDSTTDQAYPQEVDG